MAELPCWRTARCADVVVADPEEAGWAALPARPAALRRNPALRQAQDRVFHFVTALQVRLITAGLSGRSVPPTPPLRGRCGFWGEEAEMADQGRTRRCSSKGAVSRVSLYDEVTSKIIAQLEAGCFPWVQPWSSAAAVPGLPRNAVSGRAYSGVNVLILWGAVIEGCYPSQDWLTFRQALAAGGCVRKGERGHTVFYADRFTPEDGRVLGEGADGELRSIPFLKRFVVFNAAQCDGLPARLIADATPLPRCELHERAKSLIAATGADFRIGGARAFYDIGGDYVQVPPQVAFPNQLDFVRTAYHELGHWAGGKARLARDQSGQFGSALYAREELCAELTSAYLCAALGIVPSVRHADYLGSWLAVLCADSRAIFKAASQASKAADYLLAYADPARAGLERAA
jgi:antirestriction protein ArdC